MFLDEFYLPAFFKSRHALVYFLLVFLLLTFASACSAAASVPDLTPVTVQLSWTHQAEFAGLYAAVEQGYFREEGLKVTFLEGGPEVDFLKPVTDGQAQFGIAQPADLISGPGRGGTCPEHRGHLQAQPDRFLLTAGLRDHSSAGFCWQNGSHCRHSGSGTAGDDGQGGHIPGSVRTRLPAFRYRAVRLRRCSHLGGDLLMFLCWKCRRQVTKSTLSRRMITGSIFMAMP